MWVHVQFSQVRTILREKVSTVCPLVSIYLCGSFQLSQCDSQSGYPYYIFFLASSNQFKRKQLLFAFSTKSLISFEVLNVLPQCFNYLGVNFSNQFKTPSVICHLLFFPTFIILSTLVFFPHFTIVCTFYRPVMPKCS